MIWSLYHWEDSLSELPVRILIFDAFVSYVAGVHRRSYSEALDERVVPHIPVQPISYGDAIHFMRQLTDHTPPKDWVGGMDLEYKIAQSAENDK